MAMQHVFPHQNPYQPDWQHHPHAQSHHQYAQTQAAAAANAAAQQQHYGRGLQNGNATNGGNGALNSSLASQGLGGVMGGAGGGGGEQHGVGSMIVAGSEQVTEENRKVLEWIAQVLNANSREAALLELSKKREQVPDLALILWHSFGEYTLQDSCCWF
jgi:CCR4-NOT transcription complex subunit 9